MWWRAGTRERLVRAKAAYALASGFALAMSAVGACAQPAQAPAPSAPPIAPAAQHGPLTQTPEEQCRRRATNGPESAGRRIYYGEPAPLEKSTVGITFVDRGGQSAICTGVVIARDAVLTAGHCACGSRYRLHFGEEMRRSPDTVVVGGHTPVRFPGFDCSRHLEAQPGVDYAVIRFDSQAVPDGAYQTSEIMAPLAARQSVLKPNSSLRVVGYGRTENETTGSRLMADIPIMSWDCADTFSEKRGCQAFTELTLSSLTDLGARMTGRAKDSCGGDSGGPAFAVTINVDSCQRTYEYSYLIAITSRGMGLRASEDTGKPCGGGGIYQVVARKRVMSWLQQLGIRPEVRMPDPR